MAVAEMVGEVLSRVALEAYVTGTVNTVLDLDEEIRMLSSVRLAAEESWGDLNLNFVPT